ncbi:MFS transporter [Marinicellulosiphila megalodicopiae]|uniref:MFS transporter n=1 Tax=Marinicellulosiphila megalodicopiae TaxID=2724896 RepID=UPI003BAFAC56
MNAIEKRALSTLASLYALRMMGLFMVLPLLSLYHSDYNASESLMGIALGIYGVSQALFQIPLGMLSDKIGRKPVIVGGLILFAAGSLIAAYAQTGGWLIVGRALQGSGAIAASVMALLTDLTREENRTKALAVVGMIIGLSFSVAVVLGPILANLVELFTGFNGLSGVFFLTAVFAVLGIFVVIFLVPSPNEQHAHADHRWAKGTFKRVMNNPQLWLMCVSVFLLHLSLIVMFYVIPMKLNQIGITQSMHWVVYIIVVVVGFVAMIPMMIMSEKYHKGAKLFKISVLMIMFVSLIWTLIDTNQWFWLLPFLLYFAAFTFIEATLPSWISRIAPAGGKGAAMGLFSTFQFIGAAIGGIMAGVLYDAFDQNIQTVFLVLFVLQIVWLVLIWKIRQPATLENVSLEITAKNEEHAQQLKTQLLAVTGVEQAEILLDEQLVCLKISKVETSGEQIRANIDNIIKKGK